MRKELKKIKKKQVEHISMERLLKACYTTQVKITKKAGTILYMDGKRNRNFV